MSAGRHARSLYTVLLYAAVPLVGPYYALRGLLTGKYLRVLPERLGWRRAGVVVGGGVWVHAVSVGEVLAARTLARELLASGLGPVILTSTTTTGLTLARDAERNAEVACAFPSPFDFPGAVRRAFDRIRPRALVLVEAELWPNWLAEAERRRIPVFLVNARISASSFRRYQWGRCLFSPLFSLLSAVGARTEADAEHIRLLGTPSERVRVTGDLKYDLPLVNADAEGARRRFGLPGSSLVVVAGSVLPGEDQEVLEAFRDLKARVPGAVLVLAPRKSFAVPEAAAGLTVVRRTAATATPPGGVLLLDTIGELRLAYAAGDIAFVGGSLVPAGGHNLLEPAAAGLPVLFGPSFENFADPAARLQQAGGGFVVADGAALGRTFQHLADHPVERQLAGARALQAVEAGRGAVSRTVGLIHDILTVSAESTPD